MSRAGMAQPRGAATDAFLSGTADPHRYRDPNFAETAIKIFPGGHYVSDRPDEMLVTILGSCVAACIRDAQAGIGGMNHFMLPEAGCCGLDAASSSMRYGNVAMERLINDILARGGLRRRLEIKLFGGGNVMKSSANIGCRNADFVEQYLAAEQLPIAARDLRGAVARRIHYFPTSGKVLMLELQRSEQDALVRDENCYRSRIRREPVAGSVELF